MIYRSLAVAFVVILVGAGISLTRAESAQSSDDILPGCSIPKSYGRLVTITAGNNNGLASQAVFEAEDGTVRWVAMMFSADLPLMPRAQRQAMPSFPQLPRYECALGHVSKRH